LPSRPTGSDHLPGDADDALNIGVGGARLSVRRSALAKHTTNTTKRVHEPMPPGLERGRIETPWWGSGVVVQLGSLETCVHERVLVSALDFCLF
jgi:hypothetical protein